MTENKLNLIASGSNSEIFAYGEDDSRVVLKVVSSLNKKQSRHLNNEYEILRKLNHEHIIKAIKFQENINFNSNKIDSQLRHAKHVLVLQFAQKGSLLAYIQKQILDTAQKLRHFRDIAAALQYLHSHCIAHRDLKLQNILVFLQNKEKAVVKISDFGFSSSWKKGDEILKFNEFKGTKKGYMAPQIHKAFNNSNQTYDVSKTDIFALGVILFALMIGNLPFEYATDQNKLYKLIMQHKYQQFWNYHYKVDKLALKDEYSIELFKDLFQKMVSYDSKERISIDEVMKHELISLHSNE